MLSEQLAGLFDNPAVQLADLMRGSGRREQFPRWSSEGFSYRPDLTVYRSCYFECMVASESGELTALENEVVSMVLETAHVRQITDATPGPPAFLI